MPSKSRKQRIFMAIAAHDPDFAKKAGIDQNVAKEFYRADIEKAKRRKKARKKLTKVKED